MKKLTKEDKEQTMIHIKRFETLSIMHAVTGIMGIIITIISFRNSKISKKITFICAGLTFYMLIVSALIDYAVIPKLKKMITATEDTTITKHHCNECGKLTINDELCHDCIFKNNKSRIDNTPNNLLNQKLMKYPINGTWQDRIFFVLDIQTRPITIPEIVVLIQTYEPGRLTGFTSSYVSGVIPKMIKKGIVSNIVIKKGRNQYYVTTKKLNE